MPHIKFDVLIWYIIYKDEEMPMPSILKNGEIVITPSLEVVVAPALPHIMRMLESRTMADIARTMGVAYQSYQRIESGKNLTMKSLKKAALALGSVHLSFHGCKSFKFSLREKISAQTLGSIVEIRLRKIRTT